MSSSMKLSVLLILSFIVLSCQFSDVLAQNATVCAAGTFKYSISTTVSGIDIDGSDTVTLSSSGSAEWVSSIKASAGASGSGSCSFTLTGTWTQIGDKIVANFTTCDASSSCVADQCELVNNEVSLDIGTDCNTLTLETTAGSEVLTRTSGLSGGAIAGIIIAIVAVAVILVAGFIYWKRRQGYQPLY